MKSDFRSKEMGEVLPEGLKEKKNSRKVWVTKSESFSFGHPSVPFSKYTYILIF